MSIVLETLGGLRAFCDDREVASLASRSHPAALLLYLAVEQSSTRDRLQALLWPETAAASAAHRLRNTVYELRQILGGDCVETRGRELRVNHRVHTDCRALECAVESRQNLEAIRLYSGPFLAGVHLVESTQFESWIDAQRLRYARLFRQAGRALVEERTRAGDLAGALQAARAWVAPDPLDDDAEHHLIDLLIRCGDRSGALAQYRTYARHLERDDLEPLDETRALIAGLERDGSITLFQPQDLRAGVSEVLPPAALPSAPNNTIETAWRSHWRFMAAAVLLATVATTAALTLTRSAPRMDSERVAVTPLVNRTGVDSLESFGAMAAMILADGLRRTSRVHVVPTASVIAANTPGDPGRTPIDPAAIARETGAGLVIQGAYFLAHDSLVIQPEIVDVANNRVAFPIERVVVPASDEFQAIRILAERVLITLSGRLDTRLEGLAQGAAFADLPMSLEAYREFATGIELFWEWDLDRPSFPFFRNAVRLDSSSATALLWSAWSEWLQYANLPLVDSLLQRVERKARDLSPYDFAILEWLRAWMRGDLEGALRASSRWAEIGGGIAHTEAAYDAFRLNRLDEAQQRIEHALAIPSNRRFTPTLNVAYMVFHVRGDFKRALATTRSWQTELDAPLRFLMARSFAALGQVDSVRVVLEAMRSNNPTSHMFRDAAAELRWHGYGAAADEIGRLAERWYREALAAVTEDRPQQYAQSKRYLSLRLAGTLFDLREFDEARALYEELAGEPMPDDYSYDYYFGYDLEPLGYLGIDAARRGDRTAAEGFIQQLAAIDRPYLLGNDLHWQARIAATLGDCERTVKDLQAALRNGSAYWQWGGFPLLREVPEFATLHCPALERFLAFK